MNLLGRLHPASEFIALDMETTGRSVKLDVVAEIGAIRYRGGVEVERFVTLVKPAMPMLPWIAELTGITDGMLDRAPRAADVARRLMKFFRGGNGRMPPLVVHNAAFDVPLLERFLTRHRAAWRFSRGDMERRFGRPWIAPPVLCTLRLSRRLLPHLQSRRLSALAEYFDFTPRVLAERPRFHRAGADAEATAHVFFRLSSMLAREGGI